MASNNRDPEVLLGLSVLVKAGDPVRQEIGQMAVRAEEDYAPIPAVLALMLDSIDDQSVGEVVRRDPDNALGHYLQGTLSHLADHNNEALDAFRRAAVCAELRCYDSVLGPALFEALDALNLTGRDRLCALSWTASRFSNFSSIGLQPLRWVLQELARPADTPTRSEIAEIFLGLAGHLFATNFRNRWFAERAVEGAFALKAELAAGENPVKMNGYAAAFHALTSGMVSWPGIEDLEKRPKPKPLEAAMFLPDRICRAFAAADPEIMNAGVLGETNLHPPESDRAAFEQAKADATRAARKLIEVALSDPDGILGPYLNGLPCAKVEPGSSPWFQFSTPVEGLMLKRPDVFRAAIENEQAMHAIWDAGQNDPWQKNIRNMMEVAQSLFHYSSEHEGTFPDSLAAPFDPGHRKLPLEAKSLLTGRPYIYVAGGEKCPSKFSDRASFILLYDDEPKAGAYCACVFATGGGGAFPVSGLKEQLRRRNKENLISLFLTAAGK